MFLSEDENFLLLFRQESPLDSSVEFMQVSVWLSLRSMRTEKRPGSWPQTVAATTPVQSPSPQRVRPSKEALGDEPELGP